MTDFEVRVTIENLAPTSGTFLTPVWVGFHNGEFDLYDRDEAVTAGLERLAEDGDTSELSGEFNDSGNGSVEGVVSDAAIAPGNTVTATFTIDSDADNNDFFSYASMVLPSNDAFIANGDPEIHPLFDEEGEFLGADFIVAGTEVLDAGTEENDELAENTAFFSQESPDTGVTENGVVTLHPGFIADGRILSEDGTTQNESADFDFNNANFTADDYQVARITVSVVDDPVNITSTLDGEQEVDEGDEDATGTSILTLNETGNELEYSLTVTGLDFGANGWISGGAQTADDTSDDVTRLHIHNAPAGENGDIVFSLFDTVTPELGNVLDIEGNQDEDLEVTLNDDGSVTITGVWDGTDPSSTNLREFVSDIRDTGEDDDLDLYWNVHTEEFPAGAIRGQLAVNDEEPDPIEVTVTIENLAPTGGTFLTPTWVGFHNGEFDLYDRDEAVTPGLESLAEDGNSLILSEEFADSGDGKIDGVVSDAPIAPQDTVTTTFTIDSNSSFSRFFSYASMILPSNDAFIANGDPIANSLFDEEGKFLGADFIVAGNEVLDAGTEENDELVENTAFFSQESRNTGVTENGVVTLHPGFIEDGRILSEDGTTEGAPAAFNNADFTAEGYQVARITVSVVDDPVSITSTLDGEQEVDEGDPDASGISKLTLNEVGNSLEYRLTVTGLDFGANGWIEGGAQTPDDTSDDVTRLHIHNAPAGENGDVVFSLLDNVAPELGNVLDIEGNQDDDLQFTLNNNGSVTLTGVWEGTDPASTNLREFVSDIRDAELEEDLDLYWNVHTEEFPAGAIRGQLVIDDAVVLDKDFIRFQNSNASGTYLYAEGEEADRILSDFPEFDREGVGFKAAIEPDDDLVAYTRLQSLVEPGTYLYVEEQELSTIQADPNLINNFTVEGVAFHVYGAGSGLGEEFIRFRNLERPSTYLYATGQEVQDIRDNFSSVFFEEGVAFEAAI